MNNRKIGGGTAALLYRHPLLAGVTRILAALKDIEDPSPRRVRWTPLLAGVAAVLMALDAGCGAGTRLADALACLDGVLKGRHRAPQSYNGLLKALRRQFRACFPVLKRDLRRQVLEVIRRTPGIGDWILLAVDGSKEDLARTRSNTKTFGIADNGVFPQAFITAIVSCTTGLLWDWRVGRGRASERDDLVAMLKDLPARTLLLGDGNFVGWRIWSALCVQGTDFLIRVGGNVDLLCDLLDHRPVSVWRPSQIVYLWPKTYRGSEAPLKLRLIRICGKAGEGSVFLLTNVLDERRLSVKRAGTIYRKRWAIEVFYRTFKRTLGVAKLKSTSGPRARVELHWALVALTVAGLLAIPAIMSRKLCPGRYSPARALKVLRRALMDPSIGTAPDPGRVIIRRLAHAVGDHYTRKARKRSRHRGITRNTPRSPHPKPPLLSRATAPIRALALQKLVPAVC